MRKTEFNEEQFRLNTLLYTDSIWNFGKTLISKVRSCLQEHEAPSASLWALEIFAQKLVQREFQNFRAIWNRFIDNGDEVWRFKPK